MKFGTIASHLIVLVAGLGIGYYITKPSPPATAVIPPQPPAQPWAIPSPGAGYAELMGPENYHKLMIKSMYRTTGATNGSIVFID